MSVALRVPKKRAENPAAGGKDFPEGVWLFTLEEPRVWEIDASNAKMAWAFTPNAKGNVAFKGKDAEIVALQLGQAEALEEGQEDAGAQKMFCDITIRDGKTTIENVDRAAKEPNVGYKILIDAALFVNLALALGQAYEEGGDVLPADDFREQLRSGAFNGFKVVGQVKHRTYPKKDGTTGKNVEVVQFSPAA